MTFPARDGDVFLLCSDGLTTMVSDEEIREILVRSKNLRSAVNRLVEAANRGGGRDNITAVAFRVADTDAKAGEEGPTLIARTRRPGRSDRRAGPCGNRQAAGPGAMPAPPRRRRRLRWAALLGVIVLVVGGAVLFARSIYFLGTDDRGDVALYRGLPYRLPLGVSLYSKQYSIPVQEGTLAEERQRAVTGHTLRSKDDASSLVNDIQQRPTEACLRHRPRSRRGRSPGPPRRASRRRSVERAHPRAVRLDPGRAAGHGRVHGSPDHQLRSVRQPERPLRRLLPRPLRRHPRGDPDQAARRDPFLFPLVALLAAFGMVMLFRLDEGLARDQANWFVLGLILFSATIIFLRDYEALERYRY
jgi:hypothetical protein